MLQRSQLMRAWLIGIGRGQPLSNRTGKLAVHCAVRRNAPAPLVAVLEWRGEPSSKSKYRRRGFNDATDLFKTLCVDQISIKRPLDSKGNCDNAPSRATSHKFKEKKELRKIINKRTVNLQQAAPDLRRLTVNSAASVLPYKPLWLSPKVPGKPDGFDRVAAPASSKRSSSIAVCN